MIIKRGQLVLFLIVLLVLFLLIGCKQKSSPSINNTSNSNNNSITTLNDCEYNKNYDSEKNCRCNGIWSIHKNISKLNMCTDIEKGYICRQIIDNALSSEVLAEISDNASLERVKKIVQINGFKLLSYPCNASLNVYNTLDIDIGESDMQKSLNKLDGSGVVKNSHRNGVTRAV